VEFLKNDGVQKQKELVKIFSGSAGFKDMLDHVFNVVKSGVPITRHLALSDTYASNVAPEHIKIFSENMAKVPHLDAKCLIWEGDMNYPFSYCQYRWLKKSNIWVKPYYVYGNCVVLMTNTGIDSFMAVSIHSEHLATDMREQFDALWNTADSPGKTVKSSS
jgi:hypothetical protein